MTPLTPEPPEIPKTQKADEDTFLFMGTRIALPSAPGKKAKPPDSPPAPPSAGLPAAPSVETASGYRDTQQSSKLSFDLEPLARSSKTSSSSRTFLLGGGLLFLAAALFFLWHRFGSTEAGMFQAAKAGQLVAPLGGSAFDHYQRLKAGGVSPVTTDRLKDEVLPQLSAAGETLLKKVREGVELAEPEQEQLVRIYEFAAGVDSQNRALLARRAYAAAYRASSRKADAEALALLREALQSDSQWPLPFRDLARLYARAGNYANAEYFYQQTFQLAPKWALPALELGKLALEHKRLAEAELAFRRAVEADPVWPAPWAELGSLYELQKRTVEAKAAYERALQLAEEKSFPDFDTDVIKARLEEIG
jgi:tetratricopeptide (TPR) repeat protein